MWVARAGGSSNKGKIENVTFQKYIHMYEYEHLEKQNQAY